MFLEGLVSLVLLHEPMFRVFNNTHYGLTVIFTSVQRLLEYYFCLTQLHIVENCSPP